MTNNKKFKSCNGPLYTERDEPHCTKEHMGLELTMVFKTKQQRDEIFEKIRELMNNNVKKTDVDLAYLSKNSGHHQNSIHESYSEGGYPDNKGTIYDRHDDFGKEWLK